MFAKLLAAGVFCAAALSLVLWARGRKRPDSRFPPAFWLQTAVLLAAALFTECVLFQYRALTTRRLVPLELGTSDFAVSESGEKRSAEISLEGRGIRTGTILIRMDGRDDHPTEVTVSLRDEGSRAEYVQADTGSLIPSNASYDTAVLNLESRGGISALRIEWTCPEYAATELSRVALNVPVPWRPDAIRLLALVAPMLILTLFFRTPFWKIPWAPEKRTHRLAYALCLSGCLLLSVCVLWLSTPKRAELYDAAHPVAWPLPEELPLRTYRYQPQALLFDSLMRGTPWLAIRPDEALSGLENPYDPSLRRAEDVPFWHDYAYYGGRYYSYFGIAPVLLFYFPWYFLFHELPAGIHAAFFFSALAMSAAFLCVWEAARRFARETSLLLLCVSAAAAALGANPLMLQFSMIHYTLNYLSAEAFFWLTIWGALRALRSRAAVPRALWFFLTAVFVFLCVWSRPTAAFAAAGWVAPLFLALLADRKRPARGKIRDALSFLLPLSCFAVLVCRWNAVRFGSPFDFGQNHQLTVSDIHYNRPDFALFFQSIWAYLFTGVRVTPSFPWFSPELVMQNHSGNFLFLRSAAGVFVMPVTWGVLFLARGGASRLRRDLPVFCGVAAALLLIFISYCAAGLMPRYPCDFLPAFCLAGALPAMRELYALQRAAPGPAKPLLRGWTLLCFLTAAIAFSFVFSNYYYFFGGDLAPDKCFVLARALSLP